MKPLNLTGQKFFHLTAIRILSQASGSGNYFWLFKCDCGEDRIALATQVKNNRVKSCRQCSKKVQIEQNRRNGIKTCVLYHKKAYGESALMLALKGYRANAKKRRLSFELTLEDFKHTVTMPCIYCGSQNQNVSRSRYNNGNFQYTGIDRLDNSKGYTKENSVPCCSQCNWAKKDLTVEAFLAWTIRVYNKLKVKET